MSTQKNKKRAHLGIHKVNRNSHVTKLVQSRASQLAIRVDSIRYANLFESILFVKKLAFRFTSCDAVFALNK